MLHWAVCHLPLFKNGILDVCWMVFQLHASSVFCLFVLKFCIVFLFEESSGDQVPRAKAFSLLYLLRHNRGLLQEIM